MSKDSRPVQIEENLAIEQRKKLVDALVKERLKNLLLSVASLICGATLVAAGFPVIAVGFVALGLIFLSLYFDSNGHLHEVQCRTAKTLVREFSVLEPRKESLSGTKSQTGQQG